MKKIEVDISVVVYLLIFIGLNQMIREVQMNLKLPTSTNATQKFIDFVYLTQVTLFCFFMESLLVFHFADLECFFILLLEHFRML